VVPCSHAYTLCSICSALSLGGRIKPRVDAVVAALRPQAEQLPALSNLLVMMEAQFRSVLAKVQAGTFKTIKYPVRFPERAIRVCHPALWLQL
jgi:hypothetical protein